MPTCPVCGFDGLFEEPWVDDRPSDEICPCCAFQFGLDDVTERSKGEEYVAWRVRWVERGLPWFSTVRAAPPNWRPEEQLARVADQ